MQAVLGMCGLIRLTPAGITSSIFSSNPARVLPTGAHSRFAFCENRGSSGAGAGTLLRVNMNPTPTPGERPERRKSDELFRQHMDERFDALEKLIKSGFPGGDPEEHRKVYERYT